jgi:hypothetical protein
MQFVPLNKCVRERKIIPLKNTSVGEAVNAICAIEEGGERHGSECLSEREKKRDRESGIELGAKGCLGSSLTATVRHGDEPANRTGISESSILTFFYFTRGTGDEFLFKKPFLVEGIFRITLQEYL